tara:strand:+ start:1063 stop:1290 length:228 start_codon:yes stop_codon:yes gene_type:complete
MSNVVDFPSEVKYKVLFNLPESKVIQINKEPSDDFDVHLEGRHGSAVVPANGKTGASGRIKKVFPTCEIVEVEQM